MRHPLHRTRALAVGRAFEVAEVQASSHRLQEGVEHFIFSFFTARGTEMMFNMSVEDFEMLYHCIVSAWESSNRDSVSLGPDPTHPK
jgi:hypothetical protein